MAFAIQQAKNEFAFFAISLPKLMILPLSSFDHNSRLCQDSFQ